MIRQLLILLIAYLFYGCTTPAASKPVEPKPVTRWPVQEIPVEPVNLKEQI